jgi:hypothetical protein
MDKRKKKFEKNVFPKKKNFPGKKKTIYQQNEKCHFHFFEKFFLRKSSLGHFKPLCKKILSKKVQEHCQKPKL